jgi:hypothetical protein
MLVVTVELWPFGDVHRARVLGVMGIANIGGDVEIADYIVVRQGDGTTGIGVIRGYHRDIGFWPLLAQAAAEDLRLDEENDLAERAEQVLLRIAQPRARPN